jgi:hypothetical protein
VPRREAGPARSSSGGGATGPQPWADPPVHSDRRFWSSPRHGDATRTLLLQGSPRTPGIKTLCSQRSDSLLPSVVGRSERVLKDFRDDFAQCIYAGLHRTVAFTLLQGVRRGRQGARLPDS